MVNILKDFCVIAVAREKNRPVFLNAKPTGSSAPLTNVAMENPPVMYVDVTRTVSIILTIVLNNSIFLLAFHKRQLHRANIPQFELIIQAIHLLVFQGHRV